MKKMLVAVTMLSSLSANASLQTYCKISGNGQPSLTLNALLVDQLGTPADKHGVSVSVLSVISNGTEVLFNGSTWLGAAPSDVKVQSNGVLEKIVKNMYPIPPGSDPLNPKAVATPMRRLSVMMTFKQKGPLSALRFSVEQLMPRDSRLLGKADYVLNGKSVSNQSADCYVAVDLSSFEAALAAAKK